MIDTLQILLLFGLGVVLQAIFFIYDKLNSENLKKLFIGLLASLILFFPFDRESIYEYSVYSHILFYFVGFSFLFALFFMKETLKKIGEQTLLSLTILFWYVLIVDFYLSGLYKEMLFTLFFKDVIFVLFLIPTIATIILSFINYKLGSTGKFLFYIWFLIILSSLAIFQIIQLFDQNPVLGLANYLDIMLIGMVFLYLAVNLVKIFPLFGLLSMDYDENAETLSDNYTDYQLTPINSVLIILFQGGFLAANYFFNFVSDSLAVNLSILVVPFIISKLDTQTKIEAKQDL